MRKALPIVLILSWSLFIQVGDSVAQQTGNATLVGLKKELQGAADKSTEKERYRPVSLRDVKLDGEFAERIALTQRRLGTDHPFTVDFIIQDVARRQGKERRFEEYEGDISGRVLGCWSYSSRLLSQKPAKLDSIALRVLHFQNPDGSFGKDQAPMGWDYWGRQLWGHGRLLTGLVEYYKLSHDERFLTAAQKLGDYLAQSITNWETERQGHHWFTNYTSLIESMMLLYEISFQQKYLDAAKKMAHYVPRFGGYHSHGYLISLVGMAKLYLHTGDETYRRFLEEIYWRYLLPRTCQVDGSICEWFPVNARTEGCSIADWLRLNLLLWEISKDGVYLEEAEKAWFNALDFHQTANGLFGHARRDSRDYYSPYSESWWCCMMHGLFAYAEIINYSVVRQSSDLWINFYHNMEAGADRNDASLHLQMRTEYPNAGHIHIKLSPEKAENFTVHLRIPHWAHTYVVKLNGQSVAVHAYKGFLSLTRDWQPDDVIDLDFDLRLRLEDSRGNIIAKRASYSQIISDGIFFYGPLLLGADLRRNSQLPDVIRVDLSTDYSPELTPDANQHHPFVIPRAHFRLPALKEERSTTVLLVPISEQTGYAAWTDTLEHFIPNGEKPIRRFPVRLMNVVEFSKP